MGTILKEAFPYPYVQPSFLKCLQKQSPLIYYYIMKEASFITDQFRIKGQLLLLHDH